MIHKSSLFRPICPVFDASAQGYNGVDLNDCLETGPNLVPNLAAIPIRFRRWRFAITADITKALLQIAVKESDQDVHRFLWVDRGTIRVMKFLRVPFGNLCSHFLVNATIRYHLSTYPGFPTITELQSNLYVYVWLTGRDSEPEVNMRVAETRYILKTAEFHWPRGAAMNRLLMLDYNPLMTQYCVLMF